MNENAVKQRTLMDAFSTLNGKVGMAEDISAMSFNLIEKFERTENLPKQPNGAIAKEPSVKQPDIIELFDNLSQKLDNLLNNIGNNIDRARGFID